MNTIGWAIGLGVVGVASLVWALIPRRSNSMASVRRTTHTVVKRHADRADPRVPHTLDDALDPLMTETDVLHAVEARVGHLEEEVVPESVAEERTVPRARQSVDVKAIPNCPEIVAIYLMAPNYTPYQGYELLQSLLAVGLRYGERRAFHQYDADNCELFTVANAHEPGYFDLQSMGSVQCRGLIGFFVVTQHDEPLSAFDRLLDTLVQLQEELGGELFDEEHVPLTEEKIVQLRQGLNAYADALYA